MKNIKRFLTLILALVMCLAMTACASEEDKAFEAADALLAAGDYEGAIAAFSSIGRYAEISEKIYEAEMLRIEAERLAGAANAEPLYGNWINTKGDVVGTDITLAINPDGNCTLVWGETVTDSSYRCSDNLFTIDMMVIDLKIEVIEGITHLIYDEYNMDFVSEADYPAFAPQDIEITLDNWQDYFEMKETKSIQVNAFGEVSYVQPAVGIFLKEEHYDRLLENYWDMELAFELTYDETPYKVLNCTPEDFDYSFLGNYEMEPATNVPSWWEMQTGCTVIGNVYDNRNADWLAEQSPFNGTFSAEIGMYGGGYGDNNAQYVSLWTNIQVSRVTGTLRLYPAK